eukprot:CAMPEP_0181125848 /NCGR_PEP_ID=MMETSP1071-20121207/27283_1 /TAXON_ID=35127 /ORGANISM="Thalassiosira sp., Strain NH16" /LENGTH=244 /DNA_ID=CAMNT_0023211347 /DNA_START=114 /DNA_END=845 /DNA_ORIENTATION=+
MMMSYEPQGDDEIDQHADTTSACANKPCGFSLDVVGNSKKSAVAQGRSRGDGEESDENIKSDIYSNNYGTRILNGALVAPAMLSLPLYGIGFGLFGSKVMWAFSDCVYKCSRPCEGHLHRHFGNMQKSLFLKKKTRIAKSWGYRLHPTFAVLSLITTALSAFRQDMFHSSQSVGIFLPSYEGLVALNMSICFISMIAAKPLINTMFGNSSAKRWTSIQGNLTMLFAALTACPGSLGRLMVHINW